jgi:hypothetical protein
MNPNFVNRFMRFTRERQTLAFLVAMRGERY